MIVILNDRSSFFVRLSFDIQVLSCFGIHDRVESIASYFVNFGKNPFLVESKIAWILDNFNSCFFSGFRNIQYISWSQRTNVAGFRQHLILLWGNLSYFPQSVISLRIDVDLSELDHIDLCLWSLNSSIGLEGVWGSNFNDFITEQIFPRFSIGSDSDFGLELLPCLILNDFAIKSLFFLELRILRQSLLHFLLD